MRNLARLTVFSFMLAAFALRGNCQTLGQALNATNLTWTTPFPNQWSVTTIPSQTHDGVSAARSPFLFGSGTSTLQTTINGPGKISFWWSTGFDGCTLSFMANSVVQTNIYQWGGWRQEAFYFGTGTVALAWVNSASTGSGTAYIDEVTYTPGIFAPTMTAQPLSQSQVPGLNTMFAVLTQGTLPIFYKWRFNGVDIPNATNRTLIVSNIQAGSLGSYDVVVTNSAGAITSAVAVLEFGKLTAWGQRDDSGWATVTNGLTNVIGIASSVLHDLVLSSNGEVRSWGTDNIGGSTVPANLTNVIGLAADGGSSLALIEGGRVIGWGDPVLTNVPPGLSNVVQLAASGFHVVALRSDGTVASWGYNVGVTNIPAGLSNVVGIAAGNSHALAVRSDGTLAAWGNNSFGQATIPAGLTNVIAVSGGAYHSVAVRSDGKVVAWGSNSFGQTNVPLSLSNVLAVDSGYYFSIALKADGTVAGWGNNTYGQTNVQAKLTNVVAISSSASHSMALTGDGPLLSGAVITNSSFTTNGFCVTVPSQIGRVFRLEYKMDLSDSVWTPLPLVAGTGKSLVLTDTSPGSSRRFYRVRRW